MGLSLRLRKHRCFIRLLADWREESELWMLAGHRFNRVGFWKASRFIQEWRQEWTVAMGLRLRMRGDKNSNTELPKDRKSKVVRLYVQGNAAGAAKTAA
jgi:sulfur relay (sulfurtransferase) DsrC/TusE family protein